MVSIDEILTMPVWDGNPDTLPSDTLDALAAVFWRFAMSEQA